MKKFALALVATFGAVGLSIQSAHADLATVLGTTVTQLQTDTSGYVDAVVPLVLSVAGLMIGIKIVKRVLNKA